MILHTINKLSALDLCRDLIAPGDRVVLLEDGVYLALQTLPFPISAIHHDVVARGLEDRVTTDTEMISYEEFVQQCATADKVCSWF